MATDPRAKALDNHSVDYVLTLAKAIPIPIVGPLVGELVGIVVPNQRADRIAKFLVELERRVRDLECSGRIQAELSDESFSDLLEESLQQASRSLSDDRRRYIASLVCSGLPSEGIRHAESRHLLRILDEMNDIEIIWLRYYREGGMRGDEDFRRKHADVLKPASATLASPPTKIDEVALQESYTQHLARLNLLEPNYALDPETDQPEFDTFSGQQKHQYYTITNLGRLLLREIGLGDG